MSDSCLWPAARQFALILALLIVVSFVAVLAGTQTFIFRDFGMFSFPAAAFQKEAFWRGELPLWNPYNLCGVPFLAQWNTIALYPPALIYLLLPLTWSLPFFCFLHLFWGGMGMYLLARSWARHATAAAVAGVLFSFSGLNLNFLMWPSHVATFSWLPWLLWLGPGAWREGGRAFCLAVLAGSMQMLAGGPETILLTWIALAALACLDCIQVWRETSEEGVRGNIRSKTTELARLGLRLAGLVILVFLICSPQLLPFLDLLRLSQRDATYAATAHDWSMPPWGWGNFLVPLFRCSPTAQGVFMQNGQYWTSSYYAGIGTIWLTAIALRRARDPKLLVAGFLVLLSLVLALGDGSVLFSTLRACFPGMGVMRYPVKFVILAAALFPLLAAFGLRALLTAGRPVGKFEWGSLAVLLALVALITLWDWNAQIPADAWNATWRNGASRALMLILFCGAILLSATHSRHSLGKAPRPAPAAYMGLVRACIRPGLLTLLLMGLGWLDLFTHAPSQNPTVSPAVYDPAQLPPSAKATAALGSSRAMTSPEARRILSQNPLPSADATYLRNRAAARANCNLLDRVPQVDGFYSLAPRDMNRIVSALYNKPGRLNPRLLDFLAVSQLTAPGKLSEWATRPNAMPLITAGQQPVFVDSTKAFDALWQTNIDFKRFVLLPAEAARSVPATATSVARITTPEFGLQAIRFNCTAADPTVVVIANTFSPGWKACVDGVAGKLWRANYAFQALWVPAGNHEITLVYREPGLRQGIGLSAAGLTGLVVIWSRGRRGRSADLYS